MLKLFTLHAPIKTTNVLKTTSNFKKSFLYFRHAKPKKTTFEKPYILSRNLIVILKTILSGSKS